MTVQLLPDEKIEKEGMADHKIEWESVGGRLYLTNLRLIFKSHSFNRHVHDVAYNFENIIDVIPKKFLNLFVNGFTIILVDGKTEEFMAGRPKQWMGELAGKIEK